MSPRLMHVQTAVVAVAVSVLSIHLVTKWASWPCGGKQNSSTIKSRRLWKRKRRGGGNLWRAECHCLLRAIAMVV
ncbi:hypothetical protein BDW66DRAFT_125944 [Aspergillus desertorum]